MSEDLSCPACELIVGFEPWTDAGASFEICHRCGIQFGYDDFCGGDANRRRAIYDLWRDRWVAYGRPEQFANDDRYLQAVRSGPSSD